MSARLRAWFRSAPIAVPPSEAGAADGDLVRRFADARDDAAFAELVRRHGPMVLAVCRRALHPDVHTADDAFQATFLVLATRAAAVNPPERVGAWLHGVAVHVARKAKAWAHKFVSSAPADLDRVAAPFGSDADAAETRAKIDDVLAGLPSKYRAAVVLCDLEQRSRAEAAGLLGWTEGTLSGRLARARKLLADRLARRGVAAPAAGLGVLLPASAALATVPGHLAASTIQTATLVAAGAAGDAIPASVAALARGVPMHTTTFKLLAAGVTGVAAALGGFGLYALTAAPPVPPPVPRFVAAPLAPRAAAEKGWVTEHTLASKSEVTAVAFGPDLVAAGDKDGVLVLWDAKTGEEKETLLDGTTKTKPIDRLRFTPDGTFVCLVTNGGDAIHQCSVAKKDRIFPGTGGGGNLNVHGATADGEHWIGTGGSDGHKTLMVLKNNFAKNMLHGDAEAMFRHKEKVTHADAAGADAVATVTGLGKPTLRLWAVGKDKPLWEAELGQIDVTGVLVSPGGKRVAVTGDAGQVWVFDAKTGKQVAKADKLAGPVRSVAFSPDGKQIVAGCGDKTARVIDAETGKEVAALKGHTEAVTAVAFSPGGEMIATASGDKTVRVWAFKK